MLKNKKIESAKKPLNLNKQEKVQIRKRREKRDIVLELGNKYKDYETEVVFKFYEKFKDDEEKKRKSAEERKKRADLKKKKRAKMFSVKALTTEINGYGFNYSMKEYFVILFITFAALIAAGIFYELSVKSICVLALVMLGVIPFIISSQFRYVYEQQRFRDVVDYMEYMLYEFKKRPKIIYALMAAEQSCTGEMKKRVKRAIEYIENGVYKEDLYKEAFYFIEEGYACERLSIVHTFLMKIEREGGEYQDALNIILNDIKSWTERTYEFQKDKSNIKNKFLITIVLTLVMCGILTKTNSSVVSISGKSIYQIITTGLIAILMILYAFIQDKLNGSWLMDIRTPRKKIFQQYAIAIAGDVKTMRAKEMPNVIVFLGLGLLLLFGGNLIPVVANYSKIGIVLIAMGVFYFIKPSTDVKTAKKNTIRELNKEFPGWLRNLSINLQKETVHVAIKNSLRESPLVLKPALISLIKELDDDPSSMAPYVNFLSTFELPEIQSAMKMLYSLNEAGPTEVVTQINTLVERNNILLEKGEKMRNADSVSITGFLVALPLMLSFVKMLVDMGLVLISFLGQMH